MTVIVTNNNITSANANITALTASTINALKYPNAGPLSNRNIIINGAMMVDQRNSGASASPSGTYGFQLDRYAVWYSTGSGHTVQQVADAPVGFQYSWKLTTGTGAAPGANDYGRMVYAVEGYDANVLELGTANQPAFTFSFYAKISVAGTYGVQFYSANAFTKYQASFAIASGETGTWVRRTITVPANTMVDGTYGTTNGTAFSIAFDLGEGSSRSVASGYHSSTTGGALGLTGGTKIMSTSSATYQLTGLQLEVGTVATPFEHRSYGDELRRCQRYCYRLEGNDLAYICNLATYTSDLAIGTIVFPVTMRAAPTQLITTGTASDYGVVMVSTVADCTSVPAINDGSQNTCGINFTSTGNMTGAGNGRFSADNTYLVFHGASEL